MPGEDVNIFALALHDFEAFVECYFFGKVSLVIHQLECQVKMCIFFQFLLMTLKLAQSTLIIFHIKIREQ